MIPAALGCSNAAAPRDCTEGVIPTWSCCGTSQTPPFHPSAMNRWHMHLTWGCQTRSMAQVRWNTQEKCDPGLWENRKLLLLLEQPMPHIQGWKFGCKCPWQGRSYACPSLRTAASRRALPALPALCASQQRCFLRIPFFSSSLPLHSGCWMIKNKATKPSQSSVPSDPQALTPPWMSARLQCKLLAWFIRDQTVPLPRGSSTSSPLR